MEILSALVILLLFLALVKYNDLYEQEKEYRDYAEKERIRILRAYGDLMKITYNLPSEQKSDTTDK